MSERLVSLTRKGTVAVLSLNRPQRHNALVPGLLTSLLQALGEPQCLAADALVLRAEGRSFSTGGDLLAFQQQRQRIGDYAHEVVGLLNEAILALYTHPAPVVCAVQGQVTGGSLGFLLASNHVLMHRKATITPWYAEVGFSPDGGWTAMLPAVIGRQKSRQWLASNASFDARTCLQLGIAHELVDDDCDSAALARAEKMATEQIKNPVFERHALENGSDELKNKLDIERDLFVQQIQTKEAMRGIDRFLRRD